MDRQSLSPPNRLATLFNIHPGEGRLVALLASLYFFLGIAFVITQTVAFALFLDAYGPQGLPYVYIATAIGASLVAFLYLKLVERLPFPILLTVNVSFLLIGSLAFRLGLALPDAGWLIFALPIWFQVLVNLGNLAFWALASSLLDVRQGKRLFGLVGSGNWLAVTLGGFVVPPLVAGLGTPNLLLLAAGGLALALLVVRAIVRAYHQRPVSAPQPHPADKPKRAPGLLQNRYIVLIFAFILLWWVGFFFVDNIFYDRAAAQYSDANQLASFLGGFFAIVGILALLTTTFLTGPIVDRWGLRGGLLIMPGLVTAGVAALAITGSLGGAAAILFGLAVAAKLVNVALGFALDQPAHTVLYKPLPLSLIGRVTTVGEGIVQPLAIGLAGVSLLLFNTTLALGAVGLSYIFLFVGAAWIAVTIRLIRAYPVALTQALARRQLSDPPRSLPDQSSLTVLQQGLHSPHPGAVIYALNVLEEMEHPSLRAVLPELIDHPAPEVRREALLRIERLALAPAHVAVRERLGAELVPEVKEAALQALAALGDADALGQVVAALDDPDPHMRRGALVGLLRHGGIDGILSAGRSFNDLVGSPDAAQRILAAQVLAEVGATHFYQPVWNLLSDADPRVRRAALHAAGSIQHPRLWPAVVNACAIPDTERAAARALVAGGEAVLPEIEAAFAQTDPPRQQLISLARACGRIRGERVIRLLQSKLDFSDGEVRTQILSALSACGYRADGAAGVHAHIRAEATQAAWIAAALVDLGDDERVARLASALSHTLKHSRERMLFLLSFVHDAGSVLRAREALNLGPASQYAYALEVIDAQLPANLKRTVLPVLEELLPAERLARLSPAFPQTQHSREQRLRAIIAGPEAAWFSPWTCACALYSAGQLGATACADAVSSATTLAEPLLRETARRALAQLDTSAQKGDSGMLSTIEKVIILKTVDVFSRTPDDVLAAVAALLEEVDAAAGETIFKQGDLGDSLYVIVNGRVRVHDGERLMNYLGERDVFGEMALLDPEPRLASVTAVEPTRLFRLAQAPFYELMAERPEVAIGIIRVLTGHLRARVRDLTRLAARVKELEQAAHPDSP